jgi:hypothetical protein
MMLQIALRRRSDLFPAWQGTSACYPCPQLREGWRS